MKNLEPEPEALDDTRKLLARSQERLYRTAHKLFAVLLVIQWSLILSFAHEHRLPADSLLSLLVTVTLVSWLPVGLGLAYPLLAVSRHVTALACTYLACGMLELSEKGLDLRISSWLFLVFFRDTRVLLTGYGCLLVCQGFPALVEVFPGDPQQQHLSTGSQALLVALGALFALSNRLALQEMWHSAVARVAAERQLGENHDRQVAEQEYENIALDIILDGVQRASAQVRQVVTRLANTAEDQEANTRQQAATADQIAHTCSNIQGSAVELAEFADQVSNDALHTSRQAQNGREVLLAIQVKLAKIGSDALSIGTRFSQLSERANRVAGVADTIHAVTKDTRMLSLNAAVEAEKAGEHGRGFGVVAQEIRRLAYQTSELLEEIERLLREVQSAVSGGVMGVEQFTEEVRRSTESANGVSLQVEKILSQTQSMSENFKAIYRVTAAQVQSLQTISEETEQLNLATRGQSQDLIELHRNVSFLEQVTNSLAKLASQRRLGA